MRKIVATSLSILWFGLLLFVALYNKKSIDPMYGAFAFGVGWCWGGFWAMVMSKEDKKANDL